MADEQKIKAGNKASHVPYRNSKLTHLLKDALGGNSQTLFLACVSPSESNESETHSTLSYARQARNIQNKPVRNMDRTQLELMRLRLAVKAWMTKVSRQHLLPLLPLGLFLSCLVLSCLTSFVFAVSAVPDSPQPLNSSTQHNIKILKY